MNIFPYDCYGLTSIFVSFYIAGLRRVGVSPVHLFYFFSIFTYLDLATMNYDLSLLKILTTNIFSFLNLVLLVEAIIW